MPRETWTVNAFFKVGACAMTVVLQRARDRIVRIMGKKRMTEECAEV